MLSDDYFSIPEERIKNLTSVLTIVGGKIVYAAEEFSNLAPPPLPILPEWSPVAKYGGYAARQPVNAANSTSLDAHKPSHLGCCFHQPRCRSLNLNQVGSLSAVWGATGCECFAF